MGGIPRVWRTASKLLKLITKTMSSSKRPSSFTTKPGNMSKKLRQTTLPWAPAPRSAKTTTEEASESPYFSEKSKASSSPPPPPPNASKSESEQDDSQETAVMGVTEDVSQRTEEFDSQPSLLSELDSQLSISTTAEEAGKQFTFPVPIWSRPIHKRNMANEFYRPKGARHKFNEARVAAETLLAIPQVIDSTPATTEGIFYTDTAKTRFALNPRFSPKLPSFKVKVSTEDTYAAAIRMLKESPENVCVLNMASATSQGGGWLEGTTAQEEQLCYRSTLIRTLHPSHYPWPDIAAVFSPKVAIFRTSAPDYAFYESLDPKRTPEILSIVSAAAIRCNTREDQWDAPWKRRVMGQKMRLILRVCGRRKQKRLVLGAFGCGAFRNPPREVAALWKEILEEYEFKGWFSEILFAVFVPEGLDPEFDENYIVFREVLDGITVG